MKTLSKIALLSLMASSSFAHHGAQMVTINDPTHGESGLKFSAENNSTQGICKALGFEAPVSGSIRRTDSYGYSLVMKSSGRIKEVASSHYHVAQISCLNYSGNFPQDVATYVSKPVYPGTSTRFSAESSSAKGICEALGYDRGFGIVRTDSYGNAAIINERGEITSMASSHYYVAGITCSSSQGFASHTSPSYSNSVNAQSSTSSLGFNFKARSLKIADVVYEVAKKIEPFLNNTEERKIDEIKKQAQRLRSRIKGGRKLSVVRNTLFTLEAQLTDASWFIDNYLESDHLDSLAGRLMTAKESILGMVDYLDNDFNGDRSELY